MLNEITVGIKIAEARRAKGLSQSALADVLSVTPQAVSKWERGESLPDILTLNRMTAVLDVDLNYFSDAPVQDAAPPLSPADTEAPGKSGDEAPPLNKKPVFDMSMAAWKNADFSGLKTLSEKFNFSNVEHCLFREADFRGCQFKGNNINRCDFTGADLSGGRFSMANVEKNLFVGAKLRGAEFKSCNMDYNDFTGADLMSADFKSCNFDNNVLAGAPLTGVSLKSCNLRFVISDAAITDCSFVGCDFSKTEFRNVTLTNTFFKNCKMKRAAFIACRADKITFAFLQACKADVSGIDFMA